MTFVHQNFCGVKWSKIVKTFFDDFALIFNGNPLTRRGRILSNHSLKFAEKLSALTYKLLILKLDIKPFLLITAFLLIIIAESSIHASSFDYFTSLARNSFYTTVNISYLSGGKQSWRDSDLIFRPWGDMEPSLSHDGHVQMMH